MKISLIAAMANKQVIGNNNQLPWPRLPSDMEWFKHHTIGKPCLMGFNTYQSIGRSLSDRANIILTSKSIPVPLGTTRTANSVEHAINLVKGARGDNCELMVIGGQSVYEQFLPIADRIYLTMIHKDYDGDTYFPDWNYNELPFKTVEHHKFDETVNGETIPLSFFILERER